MTYLVQAYDLPFDDPAWFKFMIYLVKPMLLSAEEAFVNKMPLGWFKLLICLPFLWFKLMIYLPQRTCRKTELFHFCGLSF